MAFTVSSFKSHLAAGGGGGARPALYKVSINASTTGSLGFSLNDDILVKAASIPPSNIAPLTVNYAGRAYKWSGFRTFDPWTTTVINDENFGARNRIMEWMRRLSGKLDGERTVTYGDPTTSLVTAAPYKEGYATVTQVGTDGADKQIYKFYNLWPTELAEIPLDWSSDAIQEYTVTWAYDYWSHGTTTSETNVVAVPAASV